jgi:hypothetical protein
MGARNATLEQLAELLRDEHARKLDVVVPAIGIEMTDGNLTLRGVEAELTEDGVTPVDGNYTPTAVCDSGLADRLGIPPGYYNRMRRDHVELLGKNVNGWLKDAAQEGRKYLVRTFRGDGGGPGIARAFLTDSYRPIDNLDVLMAALDGVKQAGAPVKIEACDLTETRMRVRVWSDEVVAWAPKLLERYRSPFDNGGGIVRAGDWVPENNGPIRDENVARWMRVADAEGQGYKPGTEPIVFGGFEISNSEVGRGRFQIVPRIVVRICRNGLTFPMDAFARQHLGAKLDAGVIKWGDDTQQKNLDVVTLQARDAVRTFLDVDYVTKKIQQLEAKADTPVGDPAKAVEFISKKLRYTEDRQADILAHFIRGGQMTAGGVLNAMTSLAQAVDDADAASELEADAVRAMELVAA